MPTLPVTTSPWEDLVAIGAAETPDQLWRYLVSRPRQHAVLNDFDAVVAFHALHGGGAPGALRTAGLLCTDRRWRRVTTTLIARVEDSGILTAAELDELAGGWLWDDRYRWPVPQAWRKEGASLVWLERDIQPPLRRWAAARIAPHSPGRCADVLSRIETLVARHGDAVMAGLLDACGGSVGEARDPLVELGCQWPTGTVRLRALQMLAAREPERARSLAEQDASNRVRSRASLLQPTPPPEAVSDPVEPETAAGEIATSPGQMALFG